MRRSTAVLIAVLCTLALVSIPSLASDVSIVPHHSADGVSSRTLETNEDSAAVAPSGASATAGGSRDATILWHRHFEDPIYTSVGISDAYGLSFAGTELNSPKHVEAVPLSGDGTADWTFDGNAFFVDASRNGDVLAAIDFYDADSTAVISEWRPGSSTPLWSYVVHPCRSLVYGGWASRKPICVSDDGSTIAVGVTTYGSGGQNVGRLFAFDAGDGRPVIDDELPSGSITAVEMTGDGAYIALASWPTVYVYDRYDVSLRWSGPIGAGNDALAISDDGRYLAWGWSTFYLKEWNGSAYGTFWTTSQGSGYYVGQCAFSPDEASLAIAWDNGFTSPNEIWVELFDLPSLDPVWEYAYGGARREPSANEDTESDAEPRDPTDVTTNMSFSTDSERFAISSWGGTFPELHVFERDDSRPIFTLDTPGSMYDVGITTTTGGKTHVVTCGKGVHAGISGRGGDHYAIEIPGEPSGIDDPHGASQSVVVRGYPNPSPSRTTVSYSLRRAGTVHLTVHDVSGRVVTTLIDAWRSAGEHTVVWDGKDDSGARTASGVYFARLASGDEVADGRIVIMR